LAKPRTEPSTAKPSAPDEIVELRPPAEMGFSGTVKFYKHEHAATIAQLLAVKYSIVEPADTSA
jgi:hypothetical protein